MLYLVYRKIFKNVIEEFDEVGNTFYNGTAMADIEIIGLFRDIQAAKDLQTVLLDKTVYIQEIESDI